MLPPIELEVVWFRSHSWCFGERTICCFCWNLHSRSSSPWLCYHTNYTTLFLLAIMSLQNSLESGVKGWNSDTKMYDHVRSKSQHWGHCTKMLYPVWVLICLTIYSFSLLCCVLILNIRYLSKVPCCITCSMHCGPSGLIYGSRFHLCVEVKFWQNTDISTKSSILIIK
jgi:hypothetical protein